MDTDTIIAVILGVAVLGFAVALLGASAITGYIYITKHHAGSNSVSADTNAMATDQNADSTAQTDVNKNAQAAPAAPPAPPAAPSPAPPAPAPPAGQCTKDADCNSTQVCTASKCVDKPAPAPPVATRLSNVSIDSFGYWCYRPAYNGKNGIGIKRIAIKNSGTSDFTIKGVNTITATAGETDTLSTNANTNTVIKAGQTDSLYASDFDRANPYLFLGNKANVPLTVRIDFGDNTFIDYSGTLAFQDFVNAGCQ